MSKQSLPRIDSYRGEQDGNVLGSDDLPKVGIKMSKSVNLLNAITIVVGSVIGSGIFVSPTGILREVRSFGFSLIIWVFCGLLSLTGCYCYAELALMIPKSGGDYSYVMQAYGRFVGFLRLWVEVMVVRPASMAIIAMVFATYILNPLFPTCSQPLITVKLLGALCILLLGFINAFSVKWSTRVQDIFTYAKVLALITIIITGIVQICRGFTESFENPFEDTTTDPGKVANALLIGLFAYSGWNYLNNMTEEMVNPKRDFSRAVVISCLLITTIYTLAIIAYSTVIPNADMLTDPAVAITFSKRIYGPMWWIMPIFVACSTFGGVNGTVMTTSRMFYSGSQERQMPSLLCFLNVDRKTPVPAVIFTCIVAIAYLLVDDVYSLISYTGFVQWLAIAGSVNIVIIFRITRRNATRPIRAPIGFAIFFVVTVTILIICSFLGAPKESVMGILVIISGIPVYIVFVAWTKKPKAFLRAYQRFTVACQKLLRLVPADSS